MRILITGASRGIGLETARQLALSRQHQVLVLGRTEKALKALQEWIESEVGPGYLNYLVYDLNTKNVEPLETSLHRMGGVDALVNNAGLLINKSFSLLSEEDWRQSFDTNFFAVVRLIKMSLPFFPNRDQGKGHIVNIGSMGGFQGSAKFNGLAAYSAAKAALANLTECLAEEFKDRNIAVNCLSLGAVQTEMLETAFPGYQASVDSHTMGNFVAWFTTHGQQLFNGKILPVSVSTP